MKTNEKLMIALMVVLIFNSLLNIITTDYSNMTGLSYFSVIFSIIVIIMGMVGIIWGLLHNRKNKKRNE